MRGILFILFVGMLTSSSAQLYVLKDHRPDSAERYNVLYDSLPALADTFFRAFITSDLSNMKPFVPQLKYLKATLDTAAVEYREEQAVYRQQLLLRSLQKEYKKALKYAQKKDIKVHKLARGKTDFDYTKDEKENTFCYVTEHLTRRKHEYALKYLAIQLNGNWFVGNKLTFEEL